MMLVQLAYSADVIRSNTAEIAEVLTDCVLNPKYNPWEVAEQIFRLKEDLKKYQTNHMGVMQEVSTSISQTCSSKFASSSHMFKAAKMSTLLIFLACPGILLPSASETLPGACRVLLKILSQMYVSHDTEVRSSPSFAERDTIRHSHLA